MTTDLVSNDNLTTVLSGLECSSWIWTFSSYMDLCPITLRVKRFLVSDSGFCLWFWFLVSGFWFLSVVLVSGLGLLFLPLVLVSGLSVLFWSAFLVCHFCSPVLLSVLRFYFLVSGSAFCLCFLISGFWFRFCFLVSASGIWSLVCVCGSVFLYLIRFSSIWFCFLESGSGFCLCFLVSVSGSVSVFWPLLSALWFWSTWPPPVFLSPSISPYRGAERRICETVSPEWMSGVVAWAWT